ncbi:MAG TPA: hypothetical protein VF335_08655 [Chitinivibrionales bacterium]
MTYWIKRIAAMLSIGAFFLGFFMSIDPDSPFEAPMLVVAIVKGGAGALLFWAAGFVLADILIKGLVADLHTDQGDIVEGGLLQRLYSAQSRQHPESASAGADVIPTIHISAAAGVEKRKQS